jgi:hypothetical protein
MVKDRRLVSLLDFLGLEGPALYPVEFFCVHEQNPADGKV